MSTTLNIESFSRVNLHEQGSLKAGANAGDDQVVLVSTEGFTAGDIIYLGVLSRDGCEKAVVQSVDSETGISLVEPLGLSHGLSEPVTSVLGDRIRIYRAPNVDGSVPADIAFTALNTRSIDPDQQSTYFTDSSGDANYWYKATYYNEATTEETELAAAVPVRGDDFGHYASLTEIRRDAGLLNAHNLSDVTVDQKRRQAEAAINTALGSRYTVPFKPVPDFIHELTVQLAAGLLMEHEFGEYSKTAAKKLKDARAQLDSLRDGGETLTDGEGNSLTAGSGVSSYPDSDAPRAFTMGQRF
ncbi:phage protein Gp36 family protein [Nocardia sp. NPDC050697]|uniref:phage protein Gp36 family protein n=1 Tax=Nocardia sp. NPDC050697 TaxID=3155158 RepID=UPI0033E597BB